MADHFKPELLTPEQIGKFRWQLPESQWKLRHDCLVANGMRRSPHRGGKAEARQRVANAMNALDVAHRHLTARRERGGR